MKKLLYFGFGIVIGAGIGILCSRNHYKQIAYTEINDVRNAYRKKNAAREKADKNSDMKDELYQKAVEATDRYSGKNLENGNKKEEIEPKRPESRFNIFSENPYDPDLDEDEDDVDDPYKFVVNHSAPDDGYSEPFEITEEEFASEKLFYDKVMIEYYSDGIAVLEDSDQIIESVEDLIGPDILSERNEKLSRLKKGDILYVRNNNRSTDYGFIFVKRKFVQEEAPD